MTPMHITPTYITEVYCLVTYVKHELTAYIRCYVAYSYKVGFYDVNQC